MSMEMDSKWEPDDERMTTHITMFDYLTPTKLSHSYVNGMAA